MCSKPLLFPKYDVLRPLDITTTRHINNDLRERLANTILHHAGSIRVMAQQLLIPFHESLGHLKDRQPNKPLQHEIIVSRAAYSSVMEDHIYSHLCVSARWAVERQFLRMALLDRLLAPLFANLRAIHEK
jgi:hypothetical protein